MNKDLEAWISAARKKELTDSEKAEQRINFAFGNLPEEYVYSSKDPIKSVDKIMRSKAGWNGKFDSKIVNSKT